jgi:hypothetical protein
MRPRPKWTLAIAALLKGATIVETAEAAGVSERTVNLWLATDEFAEQLAAERRRVMDRAGTELQALTKDAIATLKRNLKCKRPTTEVRAALGILDRAARYLEDGDIIARLEKIERRDQQQQRARRA